LRKLTTALKETGLPDRSQRFLSLFPECLCGFPPPDTEEILARLDCPICQQILQVGEEGLDICVQKDRRMEEILRPIRARNAARQRVYISRRKIPLIGRFVRPPQLEDETFYPQESWFIVFVFFPPKHLLKFNH